MEPTTVRSNAREDRLARHLFFDFTEDVADLLGLVLLADDRRVRRVGIGDRRRHFGEQVRQDLLDGVGTIRLAGLALHFANLVCHPSANRIDEAGVRALDIASLGLAALLCSSSIAPTISM